MSPNERTADGASNANDAAGQGPPAELPDPVPEFVGEIHATISEFLGGGVETLGDAIGDIVADVGAGEVAAAATDAVAVIPL